MKPAKLAALVATALVASPAWAKTSEPSHPVQKSIDRPPNDDSGAILPAELSITGAQTLGTPVSGYRWGRDASMFPLRYRNASGWNQSIDGNGGRTGISAFHVMVEQNGNGDMGAFYAHCAIGGSGRPGARHWLAQPACVILNGDLATTLDHSYLNEQEFNLTDNGYDIAAIASVQNFHRTNDAAGFGEVWMGDRWQSQGSRAIDVGWSLSGLANIGLDTVTARADPDWNGGHTVALNMAADQRVVFNATATALNGIGFYGNVAGTAFDTYANATGLLARCNAGGCWTVGADSFAASATRARGTVSMVAENIASDGAPSVSIVARTGTGANVAMVAQGNEARISTSGTSLVIEVAGKQAARFEPGGLISATREALHPPVTIGAPQHAVTPGESSLILTNAAGVALALPDAATWIGRMLHLKSTGAGAVRSVARNVVPLDSGMPADTILRAGPGGRWAILQSDGVSWIIMAAN